MELEFDKEVDAILRRAGSYRGVLVGDDPPEPKKHLDADAVAAFAENALPAKARSLYMEHLADCDGCRKLLSNAILFNTEAVAAAASSSAVAPVADTAVPWYIKIFRTPNLALAMGALVLTFGGILGFLVFQNRSNSDAMLSQSKEPERTNGGPYTSGVTSANASNSMTSAANTAANMTNTVPANAPAMPAPTTKTTSGPFDDTLGHNDSATGSGQQPDVDRRVATDGVTLEASKPAAAAPPPRPVDQPVTRDERKAGEDKLKDDKNAKELTLSKTESYDRMREAPMTAKKSGPSRASVQNNTQQEMNSQNAAGMIAPTKTASGKTFVNRDGAWYDSAYHGHATINVQRGTDAYKKLDGGLRKIADSIGGTVVVVWKSKAYRIQ